MRITIELSQEEFTPIAKLAKYCGTNEARIIEALVGGQAESGFLSCEGDINWLTIIEHLRATDGNTVRLDRIERYINASTANSHLSTSQGRALLADHLDTLENWEALIGEEGASSSDK